MKGKYLVVGILIVIIVVFDITGSAQGNYLPCEQNNDNNTKFLNTSPSSDKPEENSIFSTAVAISSGDNHTCAITSEGGVVCWGNNDSGELGNGTTQDSSIPVTVVGLEEDIIEISAGGGHTCALTASGGVKCWGANNAGQLGDGTQINRLEPVGVIGLSQGVTAISVGAWHSCALLANGGVKCWGGNSDGQLGDGTWVVFRTSPVYVYNLTSGISAISAGGVHTCALTISGGGKCWGYGGAGELGDGTGNGSNKPVNVLGLSSGICSIRAGGSHSCAITISGGLKCWGFNQYGQVGNGTTTTNVLSPENVVGLSSGISSVSLDGYHTCALTSLGGVKCWGSNPSGELGDGTIISRITPIDVLGMSSGVSLVDAGGGHTCALTSSGWIKCWGRNNLGQLGDGTIINRSYPDYVVGFGPTYSISGQIINTDGLPLPGVTVTDGVKKTTADDLGEYTLSGLEPGIHDITAEKRGYSFTPATLQVEIINADISGQDFIFENPQWTLMYYLDGDNDFDDQMFIVMDYLERGLATTTQVNVLAIVDRKNVTGTHYYWVKPENSSPYVPGIDVWSKGELNMGNGDTVAAFLAWSMDNFPAENYGLVMYDHGSGLGGAMTDETNSFLGLPDKLLLKELKNALSSVTSSRGKIDVLVMQACVMGMIEVGYQLMDNVHYYVASEHYIYNANPHHEKVLQQIGPETTPYELALMYMDSYHQNMAEWNNELVNKWNKDPLDYTISTADLTKAIEMKTAIGNFGMQLGYELDYDPSEILNIRDNLVLKFPLNYIDLYDFAKLAKERIHDEDVQSTAQIVMDTIDKSYVVANQKSEHNADMAGAHGVSIHFPDIRTSYYTEENYDFATGGNWGSSNMNVFDNELDQTIDWAAFLVHYFDVTDPGGPDDPNPPGPIPMGRIWEYYTYLPITIK